MTYYRRRSLAWWEEAAAVAAGAAAGLAAGYLARIWLRRSPADRSRRSDGRDGEGASRAAGPPGAAGPPEELPGR